MQISPNPANDIAFFDFELNSSADVTVCVTDLQGRTVYQANHGFCQAGNNRIFWEPGFLAGGMYICRVIAGNQLFSGKIVLQK
ncbi:MAG: T9SS type A sorting domain-containing protein [Lentimicrobium sp.]